MKRFPKDLWAHLQNECNVNCYRRVFFSLDTEHGIITFILSEPVIGNKSFLYVHGLGITLKVPCGVFHHHRSKYDFLSAPKIFFM